MIGFFAFMFMLVLLALAVAGGLQWMGHRRGPVERPDASSGQLDRLESALAALEARMEDMQEQQRFLERLVAERPERPALPRDGGSLEEGSILFDRETLSEESSDANEGGRPGSPGEGG